MALTRTTPVRVGVFVFSGERRQAMREFAVFWGCTIPARFPMIEKATRLVFDGLGATVHELAGHTCCPEGILVKANDENAFYTAAARNLAIVERAGLGVVTPCNGCYSTFKEASSHLTANWRKREAINERLAAEGLHYGAKAQVVHFAEWLADHVGAGTIGAKVRNSLWGMRVAVHYGCHLLRPQPAVRWDDPLNPAKVEALVTALGAKVVDYPSKMRCCGGALDRVGERDSSLAFARRKLGDLMREEVDALVVVCPSCFQQFDLNQAALQRANEGVNVPVLYLSELIAMAMGQAPEEIGLDMHRVSAAPFLERWSVRTASKRHLAERFDVSLLGKCHACGACKDDCPVCVIDPSFQPTEVIGELMHGDMDAVIARGDLWKCLECYTCQELCHSRIGMADVFRRLKEIAVAEGAGPEPVSMAYAEFLKTGALGKPRESGRRKLGLGPLPDGGGDAVARLLTTTEE